LGWLALSVRHDAELLLSNKPVWLPLSLGPGEGAEIQLQFNITDSPKPFGTIIREGVQENNVPVNSAGFGVAARQAEIRKAARLKAKEFHTQRKVWQRTTDGYDVPIPAGAWVKKGQFTGRWRFLFRTDKETSSSEYINIAAFVREPENPTDSLADLAYQSTRCNVVDPECTVLGYPAVRLEGMSSIVYFIDVGSKPLYWVIYVVDDFSTRPPKKPQVLAAKAALPMMLDAGNHEARLNLMKLSDMPKAVFELKTFECKLVCPPLWWVNHEPHYAVLHSPWSKSVIDMRWSQQTDLTDRIRISRVSQKTAEDAAKAYAANIASVQTGKTWILDTPMEAPFESKIKFLHIKWKTSDNLTHTAYFGELQPGVVLCAVYETFKSPSDSDLPAILSSVEYLAPM
jgi:hypothetical protein